MAESDKEAIKKALKEVTTAWDDATAWANSLKSEHDKAISQAVAYVETWFDLALSKKEALAKELSEVRDRVARPSECSQLNNLLRPSLIRPS